MRGTVEDQRCDEDEPHRDREWPNPVPDQGEDHAREAGSTIESQVSLANANLEAPHVGAAGRHLMALKVVQEVDHIGRPHLSP